MTIRHAIPRLRLFFTCALLLGPFPAIAQVSTPGDPAASIPDSARLLGATFRGLVARTEGLLPVEKPGTDDLAAVKQRYHLAADALGAMSSSIANVNEVLLVATIEQTMGLGTNPWADEDFRNTADKAENWGGTIGTLAMAVSPFLSSDNQRRFAVGLGAGTAGLTKLVGSLLGQQTGGKFEEKARFVEFTRQAYTDVRSRNALTQGYVRNNVVLIQEIKDFLDAKGKFGAAGNSDPLPARELQLKKDALTAAGSFLTRFDLVLTQIPAMIDLYSQTIENYCPGALSEATQRPQTLGAFQCRRHKPGEPEFTLNGDSRNYILGAAENLVRLRENRSAADAIRQLTPSLRGAISGH